MNSVVVHLRFAVFFRIGLYLSTTTSAGLFSRILDARLSTDACVLFNTSAISWQLFPSAYISRSCLSSLVFHCLLSIITSFSWSEERYRASLKSKSHSAALVGWYGLRFTYHKGMGILADRARVELVICAVQPRQHRSTVELSVKMEGGQMQKRNISSKNTLPRGIKNDYRFRPDLRRSRLSEMSFSPLINY